MSTIVFLVFTMLLNNTHQQLESIIIVLVNHNHYKNGRKSVGRYFWQKMPNFQIYIKFE